MERPAARRERRDSWDRLQRPAAVLAWLLIALAVIEIYHGAEFVVVKSFGVLLLLVFAGIVALVLTPAVDRLARTRPLRGHRGLSALLLYAVALAVVSVVVALLVPSMVDQARQLPSLAARLQNELDNRHINVRIDSLQQAAGTLDVGLAFSVASAVVGAVVSVVLVTVFSIYLVLDGRRMVAALRTLCGGRTREFDFISLAVGATVAAYARGQLVMSLYMGSYTALTLSLLGVPYALLLGAVAFFLEFIPVAGAIIGVVLATGVALLQSPTLALLTVGAGIVGHLLDAYVIGPRVMGRVTQLHPLIALVAVVLGGEVAGITGALFALPLAAVLNVVLGAYYRSRHGEDPLSTSAGGAVTLEQLPRLGDEMARVDERDVAGEPVPHTRPVSPAPGRG